MQERVALCNHLRGVLAEYGINLSQGVKVVSQGLPELLEDGDNGLPMLTRHLLAELKGEYDQLCQRIKGLEQHLSIWHQSNEASLRLATIPSVGLLTATALAASIGDAEIFHNARQLAAYLGLVPRQSFSGGKDRLLGISKRSDGYLCQSTIAKLSEWRNRSDRGGSNQGKLLRIQPR
ncbi:MAG: transposase [Candidatus Thiodiazotropha sp.]